MDSIDHVSWTERYRPSRIEDCILPEKIKKIFQQYVDDGIVPNNLLLAGNAGVGKTTVAKALMKELDADFIILNASLKRNIDTLRTDVMDFASKVSMYGNRKYVILDEADNLNPQSTQPALRNFTEEFSGNCGFILTCNFLSKIIEPLQSRCALVEFKQPTGEEKKSLIKQTFKRFKEILEAEKIEYVDAALMKHILNYYPDLRKALHELQKWSNIGKIDEGILSANSDKNIESLYSILKSKNWNDMRKWVVENNDIEVHELIRSLYKYSDQHVVSSSLPILVLHLNSYDNKDAFVVNKEINTVSMLTEMMRDVEFK